MIIIVQNRIREMLQDENIINLLNTKFSTLKEKQEYLIKAAIATLIIPVNKRK